MKHSIVHVLVLLIFLFLGGFHANGQTPAKIFVGAANVSGAGHSCPNEALEWTKKQCGGKVTCTIQIDPIRICGYDIAPGEGKTYSALFTCEGKEGADNLKGTGTFSISCLGEFMRIEKIQ